MRPPIALVAALALVLCLAARGTPEDTRPLEKALEETGAPFLKKHCWGCHDDAKRQGDLTLLALGDRTAIGRERALWRRVRDKIVLREMPPEEKPAPETAERDAFLDVIARILAAPDASAPAGDPGRVTVRRLNRAEHGYTVVDLLHVKPRPADELPADDTGYGFDRIGDVLSLPPVLLERYLGVAESIAHEAILDWKPVALRAEAEELSRGRALGNVVGGFQILASNGAVQGKLKVPYSGEYLFRCRAYGQQAGPESARLALRVDGETVGHFDVPETDANPKVFEVKVTLEEGERTIAAAFTNDYWKPDAPKGQQDRNLAVDWLELQGPSASPPLPWFHRTYVTRKPGPKAKSADRKLIVRETLGPFVARAFRRPTKPEEIERLAKLVETAVTEGETWEGALRLALQAILVSPSFLYRLELDAVAEKAPEGGVRTERLDEHALASRLSYYLWSSLPDEELQGHARAGTLRANLDAQARRLLEDPKSSRLVEQFALQWLQLRRLERFTPDPQKFPAFDEELRLSARQETIAFFDACLRENRPIKDLFDAPFAYVNERLARHYGLDGFEGNGWKRIDAPPDRRGVLGQASVLMATSNPTRTSPVKRGKFVLEVILDDPPPPPLPGTDSLTEEATAGAKTVRERLERHRSKKECQGCHAKMDGLGFALERYDATGAVRERDGELAIDDKGSLPGGVEIEGAAGLRGWLAERQPKLARTLAKKLMIFALGRGPIAADDALLDRALEPLGPDYKLQDVVLAVVKLDAFHRRRVAAGGFR